MYDMKQFLQIVKQAAIDAVEAQQPCDVITGRVVSVDPVTIWLNSTCVLPESLLIFPKGVKEGLNAGDRPALIRKQGGQQYLVIGVIA